MIKLNNPFGHWRDYICFGCAPDNPIGLKMEFYEDGDDIVSYWEPSKFYQGYIDTLHGGIQATLLDEISAWVIYAKAKGAGFTSRLQVKYLKPVKVKGNQLTLKARLKERIRKVCIVEAEIYDANGILCTTAEAVYVIIPPEKLEEDGQSFDPESLYTKADEKPE